jgi:nucleotide-binding universal stress UspA family protein
VVGVIKQENKSFGADLIMMTAKGASDVASIFIGSTINELINTNPFQVIFILKQVEEDSGSA